MVQRKLTVLVCFCGFLTFLSSIRAEDRDKWQQPDRVMADLHIASGSAIADVGCGEGYFTLRLAKAVGTTGQVFAVDIDKKTLEKLQKAADRNHLTNVVIVLSEPADTKLMPESVDAVFICDVIHEVTDSQLRPPLVRSAVRAIKPGGFLYLIDYHKSRDVPFDPYEKLVSRDDLCRLCADAGLRLDAEFMYLKYQVFFRFQKPK